MIATGATDLLVLDLSGPALRAALSDLATAAEPTGGIEAYVGLLRLKAALFSERLTSGRATLLDEATFGELCGFIAPARRRAGAWIAAHGFPLLRARLERLLAGVPVAGDVDARLGAFVEAFAGEGIHRWARDLAAELLHFTAPDAVPLMTRWMWDAATATGVLREIWHETETLPDGPPVADDCATFVTLREELFGFLRDNGAFRDLPLLADLLCAHVYSGYIDRRGGAYLKTQFGAAPDPMAHTRRLLGLDAAAVRQPRQQAA